MSMSMVMVIAAEDCIGMVASDDCIDVVAVAHVPIQSAELEPVCIEPVVAEAIWEDVGARPSPGPAMSILFGRH